MKKPYNVINLRGEEEPFSLEKVYQSARRTGASDLLAKKIAGNVEQVIYPGIKTTKIFEMVEKGLNKGDSRAAIKFSLKKAIGKLGPTGFPFEKYIGAILKKFGYEVDLNRCIPGRCISYEIDFLARKEKLLYVGECKYRNLPQEESINSTIALANFARFLDLKDGQFFKIKQYKDLEIKSILVTNSKFSQDAINFSKCRGVDLLGWRYPKNKGLEYYIESQNLYPITILPSLKSYLSQALVSKNIMLVKDFLNMDIQRFSRENRVPQNQLNLLLQEAKTLLGIK